MKTTDEEIKKYKNVNSISTIKINPYEIGKADDINNGFTSILKNASLLINAFTQSTRNFIIGGDVKVLPNSLKLKINPYIAFCKASGVVYCNMNDTIVDLATSNPVYDRIDVICIGGEGWTGFKKESRAMWRIVPNLEENSNGLFEEVDKMQKQKIDIVVIKGEDGQEQAKDAKIDGNSDIIKIAEIKIKASRESLGDEDVYFVSKLTDDDNEKNEGWTHERHSTFYISSISKFLSKYYKIHKKNGDLKDGVIKAHHLALNGGDSLTAVKILLGNDIIFKSDKSPFQGTDNLYIQITSSNNIKQVFDIVCNLFIRFWNTFIEQDFAVYEASKKHTDIEITNTKNEFNKKLDTEKTERIEADNKEKEERINADTTEKSERIESDNKEKEERTIADSTEKSERIEADNKEKIERINADNKEKNERINDIAQERKERIEGDNKNRELAEEAYKLALPIGSCIESYQNNIESFLVLNGESFDKKKYPIFYEYWKKYLSQFGEDDNGNPILPLVEIEDDSRLGELATFIGTEYHDEFLICDGSPFSPDIYHAFYDKYWKKYLSYLGTDDITGWPLRPKLKSLISGSNVYIKVLPQIKNEWLNPFIKTGE